MTPLETKRDQLLQSIRELESCAVALSAGVDSAVVTKAAYLALGERAVAVTAVSASLAEGELDAARAIAQHIGIRHEVLQTSELENPAYRVNAPDRCYHCKTELYGNMEELAKRLGTRILLNGTNADDLGDYRPGLIAASEHAVRSPLAECQITKAEVRELARIWDLPVWDKPAAPCLSSRIAYGEEVTPERLAMIDKAEQYLRSRNFPEIRVRYHRGDVARVEVPEEVIPQICDPDFRSGLISHLKSLGFRFVTLDLEGFRSGSLNQLVALETE